MAVGFKQAVAARRLNSTPVTQRASTAGFYCENPPKWSIRNPPIINLMNNKFTGVKHKRRASAA